MVKYFGLISVWTIALAMSLALRAAGRLQADPTDDFSFTLLRAPRTDAYRLLSVQRVTEILEDHLDGVPRAEIPRLARHLLNLCRLHRFDPAFILSMIQVESAFKVHAQSPVGALGLMQVMPWTGHKVATELGLSHKALRRRDGEVTLASVERALHEPFFNLTVGVAYLAWLRDRYHGLSPYYLVAAYNVGPARMDELMSKKDFRPVTTKKYFEAIRAGVPTFRAYRRVAAQQVRRQRRKSTRSLMPAASSMQGHGALRKG